MKVAIVIPNLNGEKYLQDSIDSLLSQTQQHTIIVVDNASNDNSAKIIKSNKDVILLENKENLGFAGGVNTGIRYALGNDFEAIALFNNDAIAEPTWLEELVKVITSDEKIGIVTCYFQKIDKKHIDSTGDLYTIWGLPYPRDRDQKVADVTRDKLEPVFGASGGASLYRSSMLRDIGIFDEDFFAYYEDVDISFRAQLRGYKIMFAPKSVAFHIQGATATKISGFATYQTFKNFPLVVIKNVPAGMLFQVLPRFWLAYLSIFVSSSLKGGVVPAISGWWASVRLTPKKLRARKQIQRNATVTNDYIRSIIVHDLPPNATKLRKLRTIFTLGLR